MKTKWTCGVLSAVLLLAGAAFAQEATPSDQKPNRPDSPSDQVKKISEEGRQVGRPVVPRPDSALSTVDRPEVAQPTELKDMITRFQTEREQYLKRQRQLALQLRQATAEQRAALRDRMRENLDKWRELQLEFRTQVKERAIELRRELQEQLREVVNEGSKEGGTTRRRE